MDGSFGAYADASGREHRGGLGAFGFRLGALGEAAHLIEQIVQYLVGDIGGPAKAQEAIGAGS